MCSSDLCRTVPVNGHFTPEQRRLYEIVPFPRTISIRARAGAPDLSGAPVPPQARPGHLSPPPPHPPVHPTGPS